jgi:hypothetical protein
VLVVRVDVIDLDDQAGICHVDAARRVEMVLGGDAMQPDDCISGPYLAMSFSVSPASTNNRRTRISLGRMIAVTKWPRASALYANRNRLPRKTMAHN